MIVKVPFLILLTLLQAEGNMPLVAVAHSGDFPESHRPMLLLRSREGLSNYVSENVPKARIRDYARFGAMVEFGDPFGLDARRRRVELMRALSSKLSSQQPMVLIKELTEEAQAEMEAILDEAGSRASWLGGVKDKGSAPVGVNPSAYVYLEGNGRKIGIPLDLKKSGFDRPPVADLPLANGYDAQAAKAENQGARPTEKSRADIRFTTSEGITAISGRIDLMRAYLDDVQKEATLLYAEWERAVRDLSNRFGERLPEKGANFRSIPKELQDRIEADIVSRYSSFGFASEDEAQRFLAAANVSEVHPQVSIEFFVRLPNGNASGGSFPINP